MRHILVEINCRQCGYHTHIKSHTLVKPELEPNLRERILQHAMFTYECPRCHTKTTFIHNFLYHDTNHRFLVYMSSDHNVPASLRQQFPDQPLCVVCDPDDLAEIIRMREDALDDQVMIKIKQLLHRKDPKVLTIRYHDCDETSQTIWLTYTYSDTKIYKAITYQTYEQYAEKYQNRKEGA